ncbi:hypothetical protein IAU59_000984 [Kwoniella sp. CBS 9459]
MATIIDDENVNFAWTGTSCHSSTKDGDYCVIAWDGTDISVYGARRKNHVGSFDSPSRWQKRPHGLYGVSVDNGDIQYFSGYSLAGEFQATLFATNGLEQGTHHLKISNENARNSQEYPDYIWLDIDSVAVTGNLVSGSSVSVSDSPSSSAVSSSSSSGSASPSESSTSISSSAASSGSSSSETAGSSSSQSDNVVSGQYSTSGSMNIISTATDGPTSTESTVPTVTRPSTSSPDPSATSEDAANKDTHKTTTLAVSVSVIVVSGLVVLSIVGWWYWRRRKRRQQDGFDEDMRAPGGRASVLSHATS